MKRNSVLVLLSLLCAITLFAQSDYQMVVEKKDGTETVYNIDEVKQVYFVRGCSVPPCFITTDCPLEEITKEQYIAGRISLLSIDEDITIKGRGNSSWRMPKKCYNIKFEEKQSVLGMPKDKKWVVIANYADKSLLRNQFVSVLGKELFDNLRWTPSFSSVEMTINGNYQGLYLMGETIKIGKSRVNIQNLDDIEAYFTGTGNNVADQNGDGNISLSDGGFIIEINVHMDEDYNFITTQGVRMSLKDPHEVSEESKEYILNVVQKAEDILYSDEFADKTNGWQKYFDKESLIDWYIIQEFTKSVDSDFFTSVYMYYNPKTGLIYMGPIWDFDLACGNVYGITSNPEGWYINQINPSHSSANYFNRLFEDPNFVTCVRNRWNEKKVDLLNYINNRITMLANEIRPAAERNFERWPILGIQSWKDADGYEDRCTYDDEVQYLITWLNRRYEWLDKEINEIIE